MSLKKTLLSQALQPKVGRDGLDDFSVLLYQEVKELDDIKSYFQSCKLMVY